jgi:hypothetical protein
MAVALIAPVDLSFANYPGPPHFVQIGGAGDMSLEGYRAAQRGEFMVGVLVGQSSPLAAGTWVLVW